jgi:hypothetical protein
MSTLNVTTIQNLSTLTASGQVSVGGNLLMNSGYGSAATAYGCRAWVNFDGIGTVAIRASGNVSSITDNSTGRYTINFSNAFVDSSYALVAIGQYEFSCGPASESAASYTTTSAAIWHGRYGSGTSNDGKVMSVAIFR